MWGIIALIGTLGLEGKVEEAARHGEIHGGARLSKGKGGGTGWKVKLTCGASLSVTVRKRKGRRRGGGPLRGKKLGRWAGRAERGRGVRSFIFFLFNLSLNLFKFKLFKLFSNFFKNI
jgi:hypothetical protein